MGRMAPKSFSPLGPTSRFKQILTRSSRLLPPLLPRNTINVSMKTSIHEKRHFFSSTSRNSKNGTTTTKQDASVVGFDRSTLRGDFGSYTEEYRASIETPELFWREKAEALHWDEFPKTILQSRPPQLPSYSSSSKTKQETELYSWFVDGKINISYNCLDVQLQNQRGDQVAIYYDSPMAGGIKQSITYKQLHESVSKLAGALTHDLHIQPGDCILIYMPMIPQTVIAMLACARIGAVHSVVFGGFASAELASRMVDCRPKVVISANAGLEPQGRIVQYKPLLDKALTMASHQLEADGSNTNQNGNIAKHCIIVQRHIPDILEERCTMIEGRDIDYDEFISTASPINAIPLPSTHPHYILYTSGTTGLPKGVVRDTGGHATALKYAMGAFYNLHPGDVTWAASDIGWVVGHSNIVYGPLLQGCSSVLYEGKPVGTPNAGAYWRILSEYKVNMMFTAPTAFRAIRRMDPNGDYLLSPPTEEGERDLSQFRALFLAGERTDPDTLRWCEHLLQKATSSNSSSSPVVLDHWWQTELGWPSIGNSLGLGHIPPRHGACAAPVPGSQLRVFLQQDSNSDDNDDSKTGHFLDAKIGELGDLTIKYPLPPGTLPTLYKNDERFISSYLTRYPGYYDTGDAAIIDEDGYIHIMGRTDDVINTAGHRLSTGAMEEILLRHKHVADCAVIGVIDDLKGHVPVGFVTTVSDFDVSDEAKLCWELVQLVRNEMGPVASFKKVALVPALPKTRSGKILRSTMACIANGQEYTITPTIEDATVFDTLKPLIENVVRVDK